MNNQTHTPPDLDKNIVKPATKRVLAVASTGGHWEQMMLISPAFEGAEVTFACTDVGHAERFPDIRLIGIADYNQDQPLKMLRGLIETFGVVRRVRPDLVVTTGAAPGLLCLLWGRVLGAHTIWIDSIANSEVMSLSGRLASRFAHVTMTQWEHLAEADPKLRYAGSVL